MLTARRGGVAAIYKIVRLPLLAKGSDPTYNAASLYWATAIESNVIVMAACVPTINPLIQKLWSQSNSMYSGFWKDRQSKYQKFSGHDGPVDRSQPTPIGWPAGSTQANDEVELRTLEKTGSPRSHIAFSKRVDITVEDEGVRRQQGQ